MNLVLRFLIKILLVFLVIYFASKPYDMYCYKTSKCEPIYILSYLSEQFSKINLFGENRYFETNIYYQNNSLNSNIVFEANENNIRAFPSYKKTVEFYFTNRTNNHVFIRPKISYEPSMINKYIITYNCICNNKYAIKPNETITLKLIFKIKPSLFKSGIEISDNKIINVKALVDY